MEALILLLIGYSPVGFQLFKNGPLSPAVWLWLLASPLVLTLIDGVWKWWRGKIRGK
jgi:hypothetical protein